MTHSILSQLQQLDLQIHNTFCEDLGRLEVLMTERSKCCALLQKVSNKGVEDLAMLAAMKEATNAIKERFEFLRNNAAEDLALLQRQEKLLNVLGPVETTPAYVDYAA